MTVQGPWVIWKKKKNYASCRVYSINGMGRRLWESLPAGHVHVHLHDGMGKHMHDQCTWCQVSSRGDSTICWKWMKTLSQLAKMCLGRRETRQWRHRWSNKWTVIVWSLTQFVQRAPGSIRGPEAITPPEAPVRAPGQEPLSLLSKSQRTTKTQNYHKGLQNHHKDTQLQKKRSQGDLKQQQRHEKRQ